MNNNQCHFDWLRAQLSTVTLSIHPQSTSYWLRALVDPVTPLPIGRKDGKGEEDIDLFVVLGDQLIPIVCASTDRNQCLLAYGLFLHGKDKEPHHHHNRIWRRMSQFLKLLWNWINNCCRTCNGNSNEIEMKRKNLQERKKELTVGGCWFLLFSLNKDWRWIRAINGGIRQALLCRTRADCREVSGGINTQSIHSTLLCADTHCGVWARVYVRARGWRGGNPFGCVERGCEL